MLQSPAVLCTQVLESIKFSAAGLTMSYWVIVAAMGVAGCPPLQPHLQPLCA